jgi:hypothetical protein
LFPYLYARPLSLVYSRLRLTNQDLISEIDDLGSPYCHDVDLEFTQPSQPNVHSQIKEFVMSVLLETSLGDIVIDLLVDAAPRLCEK